MNVVPYGFDVVALHVASDHAIIRESVGCLGAAYVREAIRVTDSAAWASLCRWWAALPLERRWWS